MTLVGRYFISGVSKHFSYLFMNTLAKKIGQLKQWTGEKMGGIEKTETSTEFRLLQDETEGVLV
jgi:hypothetical protein